MEPSTKNSSLINNVKKYFSSSPISANSPNVFVLSAAVSERNTDNVVVKTIPSIRTFSKNNCRWAVQIMNLVQYRPLAKRATAASNSDSSEKFAVQWYTQPILGRTGPNQIRFKKVRLLSPFSLDVFIPSRLLQLIKCHQEAEKF